MQHFKQTVWLSYTQSNGKTDAGWGCMIRVVQMLMAEVIKRNRQSIQIGDIVHLFK